MKKYIQNRVNSTIPHAAAQSIVQSIIHRASERVQKEINTTATSSKEIEQAQIGSKVPVPPQYEKISLGYSRHPRNIPKVRKAVKKDERPTGTTLSRLLKEPGPSRLPLVLDDKKSKGSWMLSRPGDPIRKSGDMRDGGTKGRYLHSSQRRQLNEATASHKEEPPHLQSDAAGDFDVQDFPVEEVLREESSFNDDSAYFEAVKGQLSSKKIIIEPVDDVPSKPVATLRKSLQRLPFGLGVQTMRDPRTGVWNFDPDQLHDIPEPSDFAFDRLAPYRSPSEDKDLLDIAKRNGAEYIGSTSTLTRAFSHIYFALSGNRNVDISSLSSAFIGERDEHSTFSRYAIDLKIGRTAAGPRYIDTDKVFDVPNVLMKYGVVMEKMLTSEPEDFKRFLNSSPDASVPEDERIDRGAFRYQKAGKLLMRSQLDCRDPRLPGSGVFDIKTRACLSIRQDIVNYMAGGAYDISQAQGYMHSFEREFYDMARATMLKYTMQARIGLMDGVLVAYHNTKRIFGFQYFPLAEMDKVLFGSTEMGDAAFKHTTMLFERLLDVILQDHPEEDILITLKHHPKRGSRIVQVYVRPADWEGRESEIPVREYRLKIENKIDGIDTYNPIGFSIDAAVRQKQEWLVDYTITKSPMDETTQRQVRNDLNSVHVDSASTLWASTPEGFKPSDMAEYIDQNMLEGYPNIRWRNPDLRIKDLRAATKASAKAYEERKASWRPNPGNSWDPIE